MRTVFGFRGTTGPARLARVAGRVTVFLGGDPGRSHALTPRPATDICSPTARERRRRSSTFCGACLVSAVQLSGRLSSPGCSLHPRGSLPQREKETRPHGKSLRNSLHPSPPGPVRRPGPETQCPHRARAPGERGPPWRRAPPSRPGTWCPGPGRHHPRGPLLSLPVRDPGSQDSERRRSLLLCM